MDDGICHIKSEYLVKKPDPIENTEETTESPAKRQKFEKKKKNRRGQNKSRPIFKEAREARLCKTLLNGKQHATECSYDKCKFTHDLDLYIGSKPKDIAETCYIYSTKGFCSYGVTCRFSGAHIDDALNNKMPLEETDKVQAKNQFSYELQCQLRKKSYNYDKAIKLVDEIQAEVNKSKEAEIGAVEPTNDKESTEPPVAVVAEEVKLLGYSPDTDLIKERKEEKKTIDFKNKLLLSPLTTVGNLPFRRICKEYGADITCGEMACVVPLINGSQQEWALTKRHPSENVFGVQICSHSAKLAAQVVQLLSENIDVDFIDLNLGCPIDLIFQQGGGSALIRRPNVLKVLAKTCSTLLNECGKPFTVKIRTGIYANKNVAHEFIPKFEEWGASMLTLHGRSREQRYTKKADWEYIGQCAAIAKNMPVIGNGDILSWEDFNESKRIAPKISGVMIGRGALIKPWLFDEIKQQKSLDPSSAERFEMLKKYANYGLEHWGSDTKGVETTRRFMLEWLSFLHRYVPFGLMERPPQTINQRPHNYIGRDDMETMMASANCADWVKMSEMLLGPVPEGFSFLPKHKANSY